MADFKVKNNLVVEGSSATLPAGTTVGGSTAVTASSTTTFTNKTFDADGTGNSITNIEDADIKAGANITLSKLAALTASRALQSDGSGVISASSVTNTELGYVSGVTSAIQTQLGGKASTTLNNLGTTSINANLLPDSNAARNVGSASLTFANGYINALKDGSDVQSISVTSRFLRDSSGNTSINYGARNLINSSGTTVLDFSGTNLDVASRKITSLSDPTSAQDAATKAYVDSLSTGLQWKSPVRAATTTAGTLATSFQNGSVIDGITLATGNRILIKDQATGSENGIYTVNASGAPTRATDMDGGTEADAAAVFVTSGTVNADKGFVQTTDSPTIGSSSLVFVQFSNVLYTADGQGITLSGGNQFSLVLDGTTLSKSGSGIKVATGGITNTEVNASAAIAYSKLNLATSIVNADINASAAIAYSKLNLTTSIVNGDIATAAAIARSKLASGNANRILVNDGSGVMSEAAALTNGQVLIGSTGAAPVAATLTAGTGISITNGSGTITIASTSGSTSDISDTQFNFANNQATPANITGLAFANASVRAFQAQVSVARIGTANLYEQFTLNGIQKGSTWDMNVVSVGDSSGVSFSITNAGQVQYTSTSNAGSTSEKMRFRAETLVIET